MVVIVAVAIDYVRVNLLLSGDIHCFNDFNLLLGFTLMVAVGL